MDTRLWLYSYYLIFDPTTEQGHVYYKALNLINGKMRYGTATDPTPLNFSVRLIKALYELQ